MVMLVGLVKDFEMTFTGDLFQVARENNEFRVSIAQKQMAMVLSKIE